MDHFVPMERLPEGFVFPADMKERFGFDAEHRRLWYRGFMSKTDFDRLSRLSEDWAYRRQLEELFRLCEPDIPPVGGFRRLFASMLGLSF
jgi:hypothetical protein